MEHRIRINLLGGAIVIALGVAVSLIASTLVVSRGLQARARQTSQAWHEIGVKGSTRQRIRSDLGVWKIGVKGEGKDFTEAFGVLEAGVGRVQAFLREQGFGDGEIRTGAIETTTHYGHDSAGRETREVVAYSLERAFTVTSAGVDRMAGAAGEVTRLLREGVRVASARPEYYYSKAADLKIQLLGAATKDARARAEEIARSSGCRVAEVRRAQMGVIQITQPNSTEVSGGGMYDTTTIEKDVSVVVTLDVGLEN